MKRGWILAAALVLACCLAVSAAPAAAAPLGGTAPVLFVGNNWDGTADVI